MWEAEWALRTWSSGTCDQCDRLTDTPQYFPTRKQNTLALFHVLVDHSRILPELHKTYSLKRNVGLRRNPSRLLRFLSSRTLDRGQIRVISGLAHKSRRLTRINCAPPIVSVKNKWSGRTRLCVRAPRHLTTECRSLIINKRENSHQNHARRRKPNGFGARTRVALKLKVSSS